MIAGNNFVFIHIPRCAGHFIRHVLIKNKLGKDIQTLHSPSFEIPKKHYNKEIIASIRNPWDWYVSLWSHRRQRRERHKNGKYEPSSDIYFFDPDISFKEYLARMFDDSINKKRVNYKVTIGSAVKSSNSLFYLFREMLCQDIGFYTVYVNVMGGNHINKYFKVENIKKELELYFPINIVDESKINYSERIDDYRKYYDSETMKLIEYKDRFVINKFNYSF